MTIGHEFVGTVEAMGSNVHDFKIGDPRIRRRTSGLRTLQELSRRQEASLPQYKRRRRQPAGSLRGIFVDPGDQRVALRTPRCRKNYIAALIRLGMRPIPPSLSTSWEKTF